MALDNGVFLFALKAIKIYFVYVHRGRGIKMTFYFWLIYKRSQI